MTSFVLDASREDTLKREISQHLRDLGFQKSDEDFLKIKSYCKESIRALHRSQRNDRQKANQKFLVHRGPKLIKHFATGEEVEVEKISPVLKSSDCQEPE